MLNSTTPCYFGIPSDDTLQASIEITNKCNLLCAHCMNRSSDNDSTEIGMSWELVSTLVDELYANNVREIYISGGEPTKYPYFKQLVKKTHEMGFQTLIATNAYEIEDYLETIKQYVDIVFVSIDGIPSTHNRFRGRKDAYKKTVHNIKTLLSECIPVRISTVVSKANLNELEYIIDTVSQLGVFQIHFTAMVNVGRAENAELLMSNKEYVTIMDEIQRLKEKYEKVGFQITTRRNGALTPDTEPCFGGKKMLHITASGIIAPCSYMAKCSMTQNYSMQWKPGCMKMCLKKISSFQNLCNERKETFGHHSCAALAFITSNNLNPLAKDPLDEIYGKTQ